MISKILIYGLFLAVLATVLTLLQYSHFIRAFPTEIYIACIALLFTGIGIWAGRKLTVRTGTKRDFKPNQKAIDYLGISERELDVLKLIAEGLSNDEIAGKLFISINTVKTHVSNIFTKLNADRRTQAIQKARSLKIIR
jgi:DNA-binding NarL/FixJ family response regulator